MRVTSDARTTQYMTSFRSALRTRGNCAVDQDKYISHYTTARKPIAPSVSLDLTGLPNGEAVLPHWNRTSPVILDKIKVSDRNLFCMSTHADEVVVGGADHSLTVLRVSSEGRLQSARKLYSKQFGHCDWVTTVVHLPDGKLVSGGMDSKICMWSGTRCKHLIDHAGSVSRIRTLGRKHFISSSYDRSLKCWCSKTGKILTSLHGHLGAILDFEVLANSLIVTASRDSTARLWDLNQGKEVASFREHQGHVSALAVRDQYVFTGDQGSTVRIWDSRTPRLICEMTPFTRGAAVTHLEPTCPSRTAAAAADGKLCTIGSVEENFGIISSNSDIQNGSFIYSVKCCRDGTIVWGGGNGTIGTRKDDGGTTSHIKVDQNAIRAMNFTCSGTLVVATDDGNAISL